MDDRKIEACAKAGHEANRAYCISIGDTSQPSWDDAPDWQKASARNGVIGALNGATPEQSHESWLAEKAATGWKYGEVKDPEKKEHPCFVPYGELPPEQRAKDDIYLKAVIDAGLEWDIENAPPLVETERKIGPQVVEVVSLNFSEEGFLSFNVRDVDNDTVATHRIALAKTDFDVVGMKDLRADDVEALTLKVQEQGGTIATKDAMIASLDAEITRWKEQNRLLVAAADEARDDLKRHTLTGAPTKLDDLPKLGEMPAHKSLEEIHAVGEARAQQPFERIDNTD